jgi:hypothetical protein
MSWVHVHLILNHVPVIGLVFVLIVLGVALWRRSAEMTKLGLSAMTTLAVVTGAVFWTGEPAEEAVEDLAGVAEPLIHAHEEAALTALIAIGVAGAIAAWLLWRLRSRQQVPRWVATTAFGLTLVAGGFMGWTAYLGGQIRHTEVRSVEATPSDVAERDQD